MMNTARILSIAAVAAFASIGAQAAELNGDLYGTDFESRFQSTRDRAEVRAEGRKALPNFAKGPVANHAATAVSTRERTAVRAEAVTAARARLIAIGERS
ncbi:MAG: DUF4148 domain-containing protein [Giesbergeria sp.]|nr:DUF4148 domain-containing protein [Giesbergeria sp.]